MNNKPTYLSKDGLEKLRAELDEMVSVKRPEVASRIHDAKEHGDLSENAEYEDAKNEQAFVEGRIQTLQALIKNATIIDENHSTDHVQIGSTVGVESDDGEEKFTIVGSAEAKPTEGRIQTLQALIKNATIIDENHSTDHVQIGSTVGVESEDGEERFTIVGSTEAKPTEGRISNESPVGRALLGKKKGEKVVVKVPAGDFTYKIVSIS